MIGRIRRYFLGEAIRSPAALAAALARESAHIAQKVPMDYCEARANVFAPQLFAEAAFIEPLKACFGASYAAVLGDLLILVEQALRPIAGGRAVAVADALAALYPTILQAEPALALPATERMAALDAFARRFAAARYAAAIGPAELAAHCGGRMFATLPLHRRLTAQDEDAIVATVQLRLVMCLSTLRRDLAAEPLIAELCRDA